MSNNCGKCRHARRVGRDEFRERLFIFSDSLERKVSLEHIPDAKALLDRSSVLQCGLSDRFTAAEHTCEHYSSRVFGRLVQLFRSGDPDGEIRRQIREAREASIKRFEEKESAEAFNPPEIVDVPCEFCQRVHPRCELCQMSRGACALCEKCGRRAEIRPVEGLPMLTRADNYEFPNQLGQKFEYACQHCRNVDMVKTWAVWPDGVCDGCRPFKVYCKCRSTWRHKDSWAPSRSEHGQHSPEGCLVDEVPCKCGAFKQSPRMWESLKPPGSRLTETSPLIQHTVFHCGVLVKPDEERCKP